MVYAYEDHTIPLQQISQYKEAGELSEYKVDATIVRETKTENKANALVDQVQPGDIILTSTLVNFGRTEGEMLPMLKVLLVKNVRVISVMESFDSNIYISKPLLDQMAWLELYDNNKNIVLRTNQAKGIEKAKQEGKYKGRNSAKLADYEDFPDLYAKYSVRQLTKGEMAEKLGISRPTLDKLIAQAKANVNKLRRTV